MIPTYSSYLIFIQILHLRIMDKFLENGKLECALSKWCDSLPMEGKFSTKKSGEPVNARILDLQAKFEFQPGEPLTPYNLNRFIPVFNYRCMSFNGYKKADSPQYFEKGVNERHNYRYMPFNGYKKANSLQHYEKDVNAGHEVEYLICNNKRRRISTENGFRRIKRIQEIKAEIKSCTHEMKVRDFFSWNMVRSTV